MKALVISESGKIELLEKAMPVPKEGEVLVRVRACGLCSSDRARAFYNGAYHYPLVAGHEMSGEIVRLGGAVPKSYAGRRVSVFPLLPCGQCEECAKEQYAMCNHYDYFGSRRDGGFEEYLSVPVANLVFLPDGLSFPVAALLEPAAVAVHAVRLADVSKGEKVVIIGTGTIAALAALYCRYLGVEQVRVFGRNPTKVRWLRERLDLEAFLWKDAISDLDADVALECVGSCESIISAIQSIRSKGQLILLGNPKGDIDLPKDIYWRILRKEISIQGSWNSSFVKGENDWTRAVGFLEMEQDLVSRIVTETYTLEQGRDAFQRLNQSGEVFGKLMVLMGDTEGN